MSNNLILVTGSGGFLGGHLVADLLRRGHDNIRAVDVKPFNRWHQIFPGTDNFQADLKEMSHCRRVMDDVGTVWNLSADMGGMFFIENNKAACMLNVLINTNLLRAARDAMASQYFFASSACIYPDYKQMFHEVTPLKESDAYPAMPEDGYGWEKLFSERMCRHFMEDYDLDTKVYRFHNIYGPHGTYAGGREKAPAAFCRKAVEAKRTGVMEFEIWGTGRQTRSFTYIDDCIEGLHRLMESDEHGPLNLGSDEMVTIDGLVDIVEELAGIKATRIYRPDMPTGVPGRNSDNTLIKEKLGWAPSIPLREGMRKTYDWIEAEMSELVP
jgi:nucleoside-diphosphate-sugar epimerase